MAEEALEEVAEKRFGLTYGEDYVMLGFRPGNEAVVKGIVSDLRKLYTIDAKGTKIEDIPMMEGINRFEDFDFLFLDQRAILAQQSGCNLLLIQRVYP